jgi:hypothetical protein
MKPPRHGFSARIAPGLGIRKRASILPRVSPGEHVSETNPTRTYVLVAIVEVVVIAALYWMGRHFG